MDYGAQGGFSENSFTRRNEVSHSASSGRMNGGERTFGEIVPKLVFFFCCCFLPFVFASSALLRQFLRKRQGKEEESSDTGTTPSQPIRVFRWNPPKDYLWEHFCVLTGRLNSGGLFSSQIAPGATGKYFARYHQRPQ